LIYVDTSVVLAQLLSEDRRPPSSLWAESLISSRLLEYEVWTRVNARRVADSHGDATRELLGRISYLELSPLVLARVLEPFPMPVRTLDALHLASAEYLRAQRLDVQLATYDHRMAALARRLRIPLARLASREGGRPRKLN
jgi:predicted nucleic acid-binding protein